MTPTVSIRNGISQEMGQESTRILDRFLNQLPTFVVRERSRVAFIFLVIWKCLHTMPMRLIQRYKTRRRILCPVCGALGDGATNFCSNCGSRRRERTPWILLGCPLFILLFVALAAWVGLLLKQLF
jgi:hypothetical protein